MATTLYTHFPGCREQGAYNYLDWLLISIGCVLCRYLHILYVFVRKTHRISFTILFSIRNVFPEGIDFFICWAQQFANYTLGEYVFD